MDTLARYCGIPNWTLIWRASEESVLLATPPLIQAWYRLPRSSSLSLRSATPRAHPSTERVSNQWDAGLVDARPAPTDLAATEPLPNLERVNNPKL